MVAPSVLPGRAFQRTDRVSRLALSWRAADLSIVPITGQAPTFARASVGGMVSDAFGYLRQQVHSQPRFDLIDVLGQGRKPFLMLDATRTNRILQSQNHGTTWAPLGGSPTLVSAALTLGDLTLDQVGDDNATQGEGYEQSFTVTGGDGVRPLSVFVARHTPAATHQYIGWWDVTAAAWRGLFRLTWNGDVPVIAKESGDAASTNLAIQLAGVSDQGVPVYRLLFRIGGIIGANTQSCRVFASNVNNVAETGVLYIGGWQPENEIGTTIWPASYIKTTTAVVTANTERLRWSLPVDPQSTWFYLRFLERYTALEGAADGKRACALGGAPSGIWIQAASGKYKMNYLAGGVQIGNSTTNLTAPAFNDLVELLGIFDANTLQVRTLQRLNEGAEQDTGFSAAGQPVPAAWTGGLFELNCETSSFDGSGAYGIVKVGLGTPPASIAAALAQAF